MTEKVRSVSDLLLMFHRNERPIYFICATNFNLLGIDQWVRTSASSATSTASTAAIPTSSCRPKSPHDEFESIEDINNYLLQHKDVIDLIERRGGKPVATFLMFDEKTEELCARKSASRSGFRRQSCASAATTRWRPCASATRRASPPCRTRSPRSKSYEQLMTDRPRGRHRHRSRRADRLRRFRPHHLLHRQRAGLRHAQGRDRRRGRSQDHEADQLPRRDHGGLRHALRHAGRAAADRSRRRAELTPYKGGWCGNEIFPGAFSKSIRTKARDMAYRFGNQLIKEGYRGYFDLDFLIDEDDGEVYLGELNPRICGAPR